MCPHWSQALLAYGGVATEEIPALAPGSKVYMFVAKRLLIGAEKLALMGVSQSDLASQSTELADSRMGILAGEGLCQWCVCQYVVSLLSQIDL